MHWNKHPFMIHCCEGTNTPSLTSFTKRYRLLSLLSRFHIFQDCSHSTAFMRSCLCGVSVEFRWWMTRGGLWTSRVSHVSYTAAAVSSSVMRPLIRRDGLISLTKRAGSPRNDPTSVNKQRPHVHVEWKMNRGVYLSVTHVSLFLDGFTQFKVK